MSACAPDAFDERGLARLLAHCGLPEQPVRTSARERLEARIGVELGRALLRALTGDHRFARERSVWRRPAP